MVELPLGTVTFLFTDLEGSTRLWEEHPDAMRDALTSHDAIVRGAIESHRGVVFSEMGDGMAAAFESAGDAVAAALAAQLHLGAFEWGETGPLRARMGLHAGEGELRTDGQYANQPLNRCARLMAIAHGGQVLCSEAAENLAGGALPTDVTLVSLGEHRMRDLPHAIGVFQMTHPKLAREFPPLRSLSVLPGNLPVQMTSFVGRDSEVSELVSLVREHRMVTLTGVGGVGKTRLALEVASELMPEFGDGVWFVELAPVGDPAAVPEAVATALRVTQQAGLSVGATIARALSGRRMLLVPDNCEHVLDATADLVEMILERAPMVHVIATSREGLRVPAEHLWPVPSLDVRAGPESAAVELFVERARAVNPGFAVDDDADIGAVTEICAQLDGIALAIELAAARMVSMTVRDVRGRLGDRFRLLAGRRGLERHQTLRHAVQWSYDLLSDDERAVLQQVSVFAGGFDLAAASEVCNRLDEYAVLDVLDSLVRKSLVTTEQGGPHARYGLLETIRQFAEEQLAATEDIAKVRDRHARYFGTEAATHWETWDGPGFRDAVDWTEAEFANLRAGFRWATDRADFDTATSIAAHVNFSVAMQRFEAVGWAEEILEAATAADVRQLPRLYGAAGYCSFLGRPEAGVAYAQTAVTLQASSRYDPFDPDFFSFIEALGHIYAGRLERYLEICSALAFRLEPGNAQLCGRIGLIAGLQAAGRADEAMSIAEEALSAARRHANPYFIAYALWAYGLAFAAADPARALIAWRQGLDYSREQRIPIFEGFIARDAAGLLVQGEAEQALALFDAAIDSFYKAGNFAQLIITLGSLTLFFDRTNRPEIAATVHGAVTHQPGSATLVPGLPDVAVRLRSTLGDELFGRRAAAGAGMELSDAVAYARDHIGRARGELTASS